MYEISPTFRYVSNSDIIPDLNFFLYASNVCGNCYVYYLILCVCLSVCSDYKGLTVYTSDHHLRRIYSCSFICSPILWSLRTTVDFKSRIPEPLLLLCILLIRDVFMMVLREVGCGYMDWIGLAQDRDRWRTLVSTVMNLGVPWNPGNFLTSCKPVSFSRRTAPWSEWRVYVDVLL